VVSAIAGVPKETHVSRVEPSHYDAGTCYVTFDGHRTDDHKPYVFRTTDFGETWSSVAGTLPDGNVNVIREDPKNANLLYLGTEYGFYISLNRGGDWKRFMNGLPTVRIDDILVHPRDNDLILGTHGRSIYIMDDITALQQMTDAARSSDSYMFDIRPATAWLTDVQRSVLAEGAKLFRGQNPARGTAISYWLKSEPAGEVRISIVDITGREIRSITGTKNAGLNRVQWDPSAGGFGRRGQGGGPAAAAAGGGRARGAGEGAGQAPPATQGPPAAPVPETAAPPPQTAQGGRGGGRGGFGSAGPGTYLVKITVGDQPLGQKTVTIEADSTFMQ
jgi:hypothetical protein